MTLVYLGAAALDRRWSAWVVLLAGLALAFFIIPSISGIHPSVVLLVAAPVLLVLGVARGQWQRPGGLPLQTAGMLAFGSTVLVPAILAASLGNVHRYVVLSGFALLLTVLGKLCITSAIATAGPATIVR
jgi:hypothetical protein